MEKKTVLENLLDVSCFCIGIFGLMFIAHTLLTKMDGSETSGEEFVTTNRGNKLFVSYFSVDAIGDPLPNVVKMPSEVEPH